MKTSLSRVEGNSIHNAKKSEIGKTSDDEKLHCLLPEPQGYVTPFLWTKSRDHVSFPNVPYKNLTVENALQNWTEYDGKVFSESAIKVDHLVEEIEKSTRKVARVEEQLEVAQAANYEMEAELRKLKVQYDEWRKAAEAAAAMLSTSSNTNRRLMERTCSMNNTTPGRNIGSPYGEDIDDDQEVDIIKKTENQAKMTKLSMEWKRLCKIKAKDCWAFVWLGFCIGPSEFRLNVIGLLLRAQYGAGWVLCVHMAEIGCNWAWIGPSKSSQSLSIAHKWAVVID
ncbi:interactor of constitutive active ROPs 2, chloroplastic-like protein [Tanacetum coccineum]